MSRKKVDYETIKKVLELKYPYKFGAGAILKGLSNDQVLQGYCIAYDQEYKQKVYCIFKYVIYSGNVYIKAGE